MLGAGVLYLAAGEIFLTPLLRVFGATGEVMPFAKAYSEIILLGMPFLILTNGISNLIRADSSPRYSMLCMAAGAIVNTILDPVFIFGLDWGVFGAALDTILGQFLSFILAARYLRHFRTIVLTKECFRLAPRDNLCTLYMGISSCINQVAITRVQIVLNNSLTYYGAQSVYGEDVPLAACGIGMNRNAILLSVMVGISQGVQPIIGFHFGVGKYDRVRQAYLLAIKWNFVVSAVGVCLFQFFPAPIIALFGDGEPLYFAFAVLFMRTFLFMVLVNGGQMLSSNFFTAIGKALKGLLLSLTRQRIAFIRWCPSGRG